MFTANGMTMRYTLMYNDNVYMYIYALYINVRMYNATKTDKVLFVLRTV